MARSSSSGPDGKRSYKVHARALMTFGEAREDAGSGLVHRRVRDSEPAASIDAGRAAERVRVTAVCQEPPARPGREAGTARAATGRRSRTERAWRIPLLSPRPPVRP